MWPSLTETLTTRWCLSQSVASSLCYLVTFRWISEEPRNDWPKGTTHGGRPNFNLDRGVPQAFTFPPKLFRILAKQKNTSQNWKEAMMLLKIICIWINVKHIYLSDISIGKSMICSDIWHKYHEWYFKIVIRNKFHKPLGEWNLRQFWNITSGISAKYQVQIMLLFVYTTTYKRFVIFTCRYFKLSWNTTALSQSNCRNISCSSVIQLNK